MIFYVNVGLFSLLASVLSPVPSGAPGIQCPRCPMPLAERRTSQFGKCLESVSRVELVNSKNELYSLFSLLTFSPDLKYASLVLKEVRLDRRLSRPALQRGCHGAHLVLRREAKTLNYCQN